MKFPALLKITSRSSSLTNAFVQAIIPRIPPTETEVDEAYAILGIDRGDPCCAYCGVRSTDIDHLRPLVKNQRPTGYIHEIRNLVPCCGPCNQSKSGADWRTWIVGPARGSPKTRGIPDLDQRISRLEAFEKWGAVVPISIEELSDPEEWKIHWQIHQEIQERLRSAQAHAAKVRDSIARRLDERQIRER